MTKKEKKWKISCTLDRDIIAEQWEDMFFDTKEEAKEALNRLSDDEIGEIIDHVWWESFIDKLDHVLYEAIEEKGK